MYPRSPTLPVQMESCYLSVVSLEVDEIEEVYGRLFISLLSEKKEGVMPWTQASAGSPTRQPAGGHGQRKRKMRFAAFNVRVADATTHREWPVAPRATPVCKTLSCRSSHPPTPHTLTSTKSPS